MEESEERGNEEADDDRYRDIKLLLKHHEPVLAQVGDVVPRRLGIEAEQDPADVSVPETLGNIVRIVVAIDVLMVAAMVRNPRKRTVLKRRRAEHEGEETNRPSGFERLVGEQTMIPERDAQAGRDEVGKKQPDLKRV